MRSLEHSAVPFKNLTLTFAVLEPQFSLYFSSDEINIFQEFIAISVSRNEGTLRDAVTDFFRSFPNFASTFIFL